MKFWRYYYNNAKVLVLVVDAADQDEFRQQLLADHFHRALEDEELRDAIVLVWANKMDLPNVLSISQITSYLRLHSITHRPWFVQSCSAASGEGLSEGLDWILSHYYSYPTWYFPFF